MCFFEKIGLKNNKTEMKEAFLTFANKMNTTFIKSKFAEVNDSVKYIATMDTRELVWVNDTLQKLLQENEWRGKKCYEVLQDLPVPCEFCTNSKLKKMPEGDVEQWTHYNKKLNRYFLVRDFRRKIDGVDYRFENAIDLTKNIKELQKGKTH